MLCRFTNQESFNMTPTDIQPGDVVLRKCYTAPFDDSMPKLMCDVKRVRWVEHIPVCDGSHSSLMLRNKETWTLLHFADFTHGRPHECTILFRPFKSEILEESRV